jgi:hypothetical protein
MSVVVRRKTRALAVLIAVGCLAGLLILPGVAQAQDLIECGDAPSSYNSFDAASPTGSVLMTVYPEGGPLGVQANFPVVVFPTAPPSPDGYGMCNLDGPSYLGPPLLPSKTMENDADNGFDEDGINNIDPFADMADLDGHDDGVTFPAVLPDCGAVDITVMGYAEDDYYVNGWFDWNRDGDWNDDEVCGCGDSEWGVRDVPVVAGYFSVDIPIVPCHPGSDTDPLWVRVTLSPESSEVMGDEWEAGAVNYWEGMPTDGETEDYYLEPETGFVPEWGSIALLGSGLAGLAGYATLRQRSGQGLRWRKR